MNFSEVNLGEYIKSNKTELKDYFVYYITG